MNNGSPQTPPVTPAMNSSIPLSRSPEIGVPELATVAIRLQAPDQNAPTRVHHAPLSPENPYIYADNGFICIENQAAIPLTKCIVTNEYADRTVKLALRDPKNPNTWWGKRPHLRIGLADSVVKKIRYGAMATWVAIGLGAASIALGTIATLLEFNSILTLFLYGVGVSLAVTAGFFRANAPISAPTVGRSFTLIKGAHSDFLKQFDRYEDGKLIESDF